jgi:hypothetical protein
MQVNTEDFFIYTTREKEKKKRVVVEFLFFFFVCRFRCWTSEDVYENSHRTVLSRTPKPRKAFLVGERICDRPSCDVFSFRIQKETKKRGKIRGSISSWF